MRRAVAAARGLLLLLPLLLSGCLDYAEVITLNPDGSGRLEAEATLDLGLVRRLSLALGEEPDAGELASPGRDEVLAALSVEGVTVRELRVDDLGERTRIQVALDFADLEALRRLEGFAARRRLELFDAGGGQALLVSSFDPREVIPLPEEAARWPRQGDGADLEQVVAELRRSVRLRSELRLPGPVLASNGHADAAPPGLDRAAWAVDALLAPERHVDLGRREVLMRVLCDRSSVPWARELAPVPPEVGSVTDDALGAAAAVTSSGRPAGARGRGGAGCSLASPPTSASPWAFGWLLVGLGLVLGRSARARRAA